MDHTVKNKHFPGVFEATPLRAPVRPWGHAPRQANPVLTQGRAGARRGAQGRDTPPNNSCQYLKILWALFWTLMSVHPLFLQNVHKIDR